MHWFFRDFTANNLLKINFDQFAALHTITAILASLRGLKETSAGIRLLSDFL